MTAGKIRKGLCLLLGLVLLAAFALGEETVVPETEFAFSAKVNLGVEFCRTLVGGTKIERALLSAIIADMASAKEEMIRPEGLDDELFNSLADYQIAAVSVAAKEAEGAGMFIGMNGDTYVVVLCAPWENRFIKSEILYDAAANSGKMTLVVWSARPEDLRADMKASLEEYGATLFSEIPLANFAEAFNSLTGTVD